MEELYKKWCKETKRNGAVLVGGSIKEFFDWLEKEESNIKVSKIMVENKYCLDTRPTDTGVFCVDIPKVIGLLNRDYILIKR
jgi:hypothetical protein